MLFIKLLLSVYIGLFASPLFAAHNIPCNQNDNLRVEKNGNVYCCKTFRLYKGGDLQCLMKFTDEQGIAWKIKSYFEPPYEILLMDDE